MQINQYHIFELVRGEDGFPKHGGVHWFNTYTEKNGKKRFLIDDYDDDGKPIKKNVIISEENPLMVNKANVELYEFLINHPNFENGVNFNGNAIFRIVDLERDARERTENKILRAKAIAHASQLSGASLYETCALFGSFFDRDSEAQALEFIIGQAEREPENYLKLAKGNRFDAKIRYILANAIRQGLVIKQPNGALKFGTLVLGISEDYAVSRLTTDPETLKAISERVNYQETEIADLDEKEEEQPELTAADAAKFAAPKAGRPAAKK